MQMIPFSLAMVSILTPLPAFGQTSLASEVSGDPAFPAVLPPSKIETRIGETSESSVGRTGQRRTREQISAQAGLEPMGRISGRLETRIQSRIRNRIDRYYDSQADANSSFSVASDHLRTSTK